MAHKVISVPFGDPRWETTRDVDDLPEHLRLEMEHFFTVYKQLEKKKTAVLGWRPLAIAETVIAEALARFPK